MNSVLLRAVADSQYIPTSDLTPGCQDIVGRKEATGCGLGEGGPFGNLVRSRLISRSPDDLYHSFNGRKGSLGIYALASNPRLASLASSRAIPTFEWYSVVNGLVSAVAVAPLSTGIVGSLAANHVRPYYKDS